MVDNLPAPPEGEDANAGLSIKVYPSVRDEIERLAITEGRNRSQQAHWLLREALEARRKGKKGATRQQVRMSGDGFTTRPPGALDDNPPQIDVALPADEDVDAAEAVG